MAEIQSLEELRAENAAKEDGDNQVKTNVQEVRKPSLDVEPDSEVTDTLESDDHQEGSEQDGEVESWMQADEATSESDQGGFKPNHEAAKKRQIIKSLKGSLNEKDDELSQLREELERLKSAAAPKQQVENQLPPRPKREDFDYDDDAYDNAIDEWNDKKLELKLSSHTQSYQQKQQQEQQQKAQSEAMQQAIDDHYARASELVAQGKVSAELYTQADTTVRKALQEFSGNGDQMADTLISSLNNLGEGSEKVMYQLGVNPSKLNEFLGLLRRDPTGLAASAYLGRLQASITEPQKRKSSAPKPASAVNGDSGGDGLAGKLKQQYSKEQDVGKRISMKRKAKADGVDVSNW